MSETPYAATASDYWAAGWRGVLPLPPGKKHPPPDGYTGASGLWPSYADVMTWVEDSPTANVAIRLPPDIIGIDVDTYDGKQGIATIQAAVARWGHLPPTWMSTSRGTGFGFDASGIYLFRVPLGLRWPGQVGPDVEIIQTRHRYMVAPPSRHPGGRGYGWYTPQGIAQTGAPPWPSSLPDLPDTWVQGLSGGESALDTLKDEPTRAEVGAWLEARPAVTTPCRITLARLDRLLSDLTTSGSRHDVALRGVMAFVHLAGEGHRGTTVALSDFKREWLRAVTSPGAGQRDASEADAEWWRMLSGAVGAAQANGHGHPLGQDADPCSDPLAGILPPAHQNGAPLPHQNRQGDAVPPPVATALGAPPDQGGAGMVPPAWVTEQSPDNSGDPDISSTGDTDVWDKHAVAVALEVERLEIRREARLEVIRADHMRTWREPPSYSLADMLALPDEPLKWRVHDVMPEGSNVLLAAQFKAGKTTLVNELTRALVDGQAFLDTYKVLDTARVALFNYEVSQAQYARWLRDRGISSTDSVHVFNLRGFTLPLSVPMVRSYVVRWLADRNIGVWIVDPFARAFIGGNENDNSEVAEWLSILDEIKQEAGVSELVMPTHTGRAIFEPGAERARGATRLDDWCDVRWLLTRDDEGARYFRATGRDVETEETRLEYDPLTRAVTLGEGARPRHAGRGAPGAQNGAQGLEDAVLEALADEPGAGVRQLRGEVRLRLAPVGNARIDDAVRRLAQQGRIRLEHTSQGARPVIRHWPVGSVGNE